jgi:hypothetical protein
MKHRRWIFFLRNNVQSDSVVVFGQAKKASHDRTPLENVRSKEEVETNGTISVSEEKKVISLVRNSTGFQSY